MRESNNKHLTKRDGNFLLLKKICTGSKKKKNVAADLFEATATKKRGGHLARKKLSESSL